MSTRISQLSELAETPAGNDLLVINDVSDTTQSPEGSTKHITIDSFLPRQTDWDTAYTTVTANSATWSQGGGSDVSGLSANWETAYTTATAVSATYVSDADLRGTDTPHIGAHPDQSYNTTNNIYKAVMITADADGSVTFSTKSDDAKIYLNTPSQKLALTAGLSVREDSTEPDVEIESNGKTYSVISGDSDSKGANGLPIRQGFNNPDIGAYPAPILISGGTVS